MKTQQPEQATARYYSRWGSRLGYLLVMKRSQHFGYYDEQHINEDAAQRKYHEEFVKLLDLKAGMRVLDAGCGQGVVACYIAKHNDVHVTGITIAKHEVKSATRRAKSEGIAGRTSFLLGDYSKSLFPAASFDRIYTTESLSHAPDVKKVLVALEKCLKPGGRVVFAEYEMDYRQFDAKEKSRADFIKKYAAIHGVYQFGDGEFPSNIKNAGLGLVREIDWTAHMKPSFDRLRRIAKPIAAVTRSLKLDKFSVNTMSASIYSDWVEKGLFSYKVYIAKKPM